MSKAFTLRIELGNDAMQSYYDIEQALCRLMDRLQSEREPAPGQYGCVYDLDGNQVGDWKIQRSRA